METLQKRVKIQVRSTGDGTSLIDLQGRLTGLAEEELLAAYDQATAGHGRPILLNFAGLESLDSSGLGLLVTLLTRAQRQQQRLLASGLSEHHRQVLEFTRLDEALSETASGLPMDQAEEPEAAGGSAQSQDGLGTLPRNGLGTPPRDGSGTPPRDTAYWARPVSRLQVPPLPAGAINLNVAGRRVNSPLQGFGQLWRKTYRVRLEGATVTPGALIGAWKEHFPEFWPAGNRFYAPLQRIAPGEVAVLNLAMPGGLTLATGVLVVYADDESFAFMAPEGHIMAGMITLSAYQDSTQPGTASGLGPGTASGFHQGTTVAQVQALFRASDPLYELSLRLRFGHLNEDRFWQRTLETLAAHFGVQAKVEQQAVCLDRQMQWSRASNIAHNAGVRSAAYALVAPVRWLRNRLQSPEAVPGRR